MDFDFRLLIVLSPILLAGSWALLNIFKAASKQLDGFLSEK